jgi:dTMP kinase
MHATMCGGLDPDLTILLLPDFDRSLTRARRRNDRTSGQDEGRFEGENQLFHRRVFEKYREIAARDAARFLVIEGDRSIPAIHRAIAAAVDEKLRSAGLLPSLPAVGAQE